MSKAFTVWLTGLPGSGKTTLARLLENELRTMGKKVEVLDGDEVRQWLSPEAGFSREDRERHLRRAAYVSHLLTRNGIVVIASFVSPYRSTRDFARQLIRDFVEVYLDCPLEVCVQRDPKGLYRKAKQGEIGDLTGLQDPYEEPLSPELILHTENGTPSENVRDIIEKLSELRYLDRTDVPS